MCTPILEKFISYVYTKYPDNGKNINEARLLLSSAKEGFRVLPLSLDALGLHTKRCWGNSISQLKSSSPTGWGWQLKWSTTADLLSKLMIICGPEPEPDCKPEKVNRIRPDRPDRPEFYRIF